MSTTGTKDLDPRQLAFKEAFLSPDSDSFGSARASALKAGYSESYANNLTAQGSDWLCEVIRDVQRLSKAEKVLDEMLEMDTVGDAVMARIKQDTAKYVTSRMGKDKYSDRQELTGKDGKDLSLPTTINIVKPDERT